MPALGGKSIGFAARPGQGRPQSSDLRDFCWPKPADWPPGLDRLACAYSRNSVTVRPLGV